MRVESISDSKTQNSKQQHLERPRLRAKMSETTFKFPLNFGVGSNHRPELFTNISQK